jgi:hypothetical protein
VVSAAARAPHLLIQIQQQEKIPMHQSLAGIGSAAGGFG